MRYIRDRSRKNIPAFSIYYLRANIHSGNAFSSVGGRVMLGTLDERFHQSGSCVCVCVCELSFLNSLSKNKNVFGTYPVLKRFSASKV